VPRVFCSCLVHAGKPIIKWRQLELGLQLPEGGPNSRLPLRPLALPPQPPQQQPGGSQPRGRAAAFGSQPASRGASLGHEAGPGADDEEEATIPAVVSSEGQQAAAAAGSGLAGGGPAQDPRFAPYARARLHSWLGSTGSTGSAAAAAAAASGGPQAGGAGAPGQLGAGAAAAEDAESLGAGPCSLLDVTLIGFELCVPYDREPGPCQRYAELYFKALQLVSLLPFPVCPPPPCASSLHASSLCLLCKLLAGLLRH
jgi:hypothetical protein